MLFKCDSLLTISNAHSNGKKPPRKLIKAIRENTDKVEKYIDELEISLQERYESANRVGNPESVQIITDPDESILLFSHCSISTKSL